MEDLSRRDLEDDAIFEATLKDKGVVLFRNPLARNSNYWKFIYLIAPTSALPTGQGHWTSSDAVAAYCALCKVQFKFTKGSSNSVRRHLEAQHMEASLDVKRNWESANSTSNMIMSNMMPPDSDDILSMPPTKKLRKMLPCISGNIDGSSCTQYEHLLPPCWVHTVLTWLKTDVPSFDVGGFVVGDKPEVSHLYGKSKGILAGVPFFNAVFDALDCTVEWIVPEGNVVDPSSTTDGKVLVAIVSGSCRNILLGERTALNVLTRSSGIATIAYEAVAVAREAGWHGQVAGTRKTTPGFRLAEKYSLLVAGASTHRHDLSQMVMLKDNHIWSTGSITNAVLKAKRAAGFSMKIEVECQSLDDAIEAAEAGADIVMLDNFTPETLHPTAETLKERFPHLLIEASGGITMETMPSFFSPHVDIISQGRLTQGYPCLDFSLKIQRPSSAASGTLI